MVTDGDKRHLVKLTGIRYGKRPFTQQLIFETLDGFYIGRLFMDLEIAVDEEECPTTKLWQKLTGKPNPSLDALEEVFAQPLVAIVEKLKKENGPDHITITDISLVD